MTTPTGPKKGRATPRLGNLPLQFNFFLNPYTDVRFTIPKAQENKRSRNRSRRPSVDANCSEAYRDRDVHIAATATLPPRLDHTGASP